MSVLQFIASLASSLAWPTFALIAVLVFRKPISKVVSGVVSGRLLKKVKLGPVEAEWDALDDAERDVAASVSKGEAQYDGRSPVAAVDFSEIFALAEISPPAAVLMAFQRVEIETRTALQEHSLVDPNKAVAPNKLFDCAVMNGLITKEMGDAMQSLRYLRNKVSHYTDEVVTKGRAVQYALIAAEAVAALRREEGRDK